MRYKRQAIRDVGNFMEVLRDRASHSDGGKRQGPICWKKLRDTISGGKQKFELFIAHFPLLSHILETVQK